MVTDGALACLGTFVPGTAKQVPAIAKRPSNENMVQKIDLDLDRKVCGTIEVFLYNSMTSIPRSTRRPLTLPERVNCGESGKVESAYRIQT
jgi:hypothetical protein